MGRSAGQASSIVAVISIPDAIRVDGYFLRRRDLLGLGYTDAGIRASLAKHEIFRVRQGWFSVPDAPAAGVLAVRVGGQLTGRSALESYGIAVPRPSRIRVMVRANACNLRDAADGRKRRDVGDAADVRWTGRTDEPVSCSWRVSPREALLEILGTEERDIAIACCDALLNSRTLTIAEVEEVFRCAPARVQPWVQLVDGRSGAFGETWVRLWLGDEGIRFEPQPHRQGVGWLDGRISKWTFVEIDGAQHAEEGWGPRAAGSSDRLEQMEKDHRRDTVLAVGGERTLRFTYRLLLREWSLCLAAMRRAIADDERRERLERAHSKS